MSMSLMAKAMSIKVGNPIRKLVLLKLADNANDKGECWPSYQHIADHCECSKSTARDHIDALEKAGLLVKENRTGTNNGKGNASNVYYLKLDNPMPTASTPPMPGNGTPMPAGGTPPMPTGGTRISHSFEPVIEPKTPLPPTGGISPEPAGKNPTPKPKPEQSSTQ
ncbi:helix-turn-helix domain-containing protein, partial [Sodalis sp. (in: enterobacteria)]|uniref:helix-turn-helix domain-containing protein n=1 Tax=Sodalis sp. (in: enterobacteria) TaxID=1898979 RepID=UPI003F2D3615